MSEWMPIETAPKGDGYVDLWCKGGFRIPNAKWEVPRFDFREEEVFEANQCWCLWSDNVQVDYDEWSSGYKEIKHQPTHWMPLPDPPK